VTPLDISAERFEALAHRVVDSVLVCGSRGQKFAHCDLYLLDNAVSVASFADPNTCPPKTPSRNF
jgi:hypothetical protein